MNLTKKQRRHGRVLTAGMIAVAMVVQILPVLPASAAEVMRQTFTEEQISANDDVLYTVNCGTADPQNIPEGAVKGLYQSNLEQAKGEDSETGLTWGYLPDDEYSRRVSKDGSSLADACIYMGDGITFAEGKTGFGYDFELPDRAGNKYSVTIGIKIPQWWADRSCEIQLEGEAKGTESFTNNQLKEVTYETEVTDNELNVFVHNPEAGDNRGLDPILSYIIVKVAPSELLKELRETIKTCQDQYDAAVKAQLYTEESKKAVTDAIKAAQGLVDKNSKDDEQITAASEALKNTFEGLVKANGPVYTTISGTNGGQIYTTDGSKIQAHGGQVQKLGDTYYWIGEDRTNGYTPMPGVHMYSSKDLYNWKDEGVVLRTMENEEQFETDEYFKALYGSLSTEQKREIYVDLWAGGCVMERPKMLYNEKTGKYVLWFHADGKSPYEQGGDSNYAKAKAGIAVADNPAGPYTLLGSYMLASDQEDNHNNHGFDSVGGHVRDMNVFQDDDGKAYVMYSSEGNAVMYIARLNDNYTGLAKDAAEMVMGEDFCISSTDSREAPAMFKYQNKYYLITSGCTGWAPNQARYAVSDSPLGPWENMGDPCVGDTSHNTFETQSTCVIPVNAKEGQFIYMGDRWYNPDQKRDLSDSRYVWLPIEFGAGSTIMIKNYKDWTLEDLKNKGSLEIMTNLPENVSSVKNLRGEFPQKIDVKIGGTSYSEQPVTWSVAPDKRGLGDYALGDVTVTGKLKELNREFTVKVFCTPESIVYFADCNTNDTSEESKSKVFEKIKSIRENLLNDVSDQAYGEGKTWGYTSTPGASGGGSQQDMGSHGPGEFYDSGWWATDEGSIEYRFKLDPGNYVVSTGYQEWWSGNRGTRITAVSVDADGNEETVGTGTFTLSGQRDMQQQTEIAVPEGSDHVLVRISKVSGGAPVLSWIGISGDTKTTITAENGAVYYVDSQNGDDSKDGKSPESAWKTLDKVSSVRGLTAGNKILFKSGSEWNGEQLTVKDAKGTKENPVVIGSYGSGEKPQINGEGGYWRASSKEEYAAVHVFNSEYIVIENLAITNWDEEAGGEFSQSSRLLSGLVVENRDAGTLSDVVIRNNRIFDVNGLMRGGAEKAAGGLIVVVTGDGDNHTGKVESRYDGLTISGNEVYNVCHEAIYLESVWASRKLVGGTSSDTGYQNAGNSKWVGSSNVTIEHNYVHDVAGDGIVPINTTDALVQYNLIHNSADSRWDYSANPNHAALWAWDADNVTFRYNEACHTSEASEGKAVGNDSMAFDFDYGVQNCVYEYNYSHDNLGGFLMLCPGPGATVNNIARYNVSVNDGLYDGAPVIRMGSGKYGSLGVQIYNNTIYWTDTGYTMSLMPASAWEGNAIKGVEVFNNIFHGPAKENSVTTTGVAYHDNSASGGAEIAYQAAVKDENTITSEPKFLDVNGYTEGSWKDGKTTLGRVDGFKTADNSPCIDKGAAHPAAPGESTDELKSELRPNPAEKPKTDYYGNELKDEKIDIGAYEFTGVKTADREALNAVIDRTKNLKETDYTASSWAAMQEALKAANEIRVNEAATQDEVVAATKALRDALAALVSVDKAGLRDAIDRANERKEADYTRESWAAMQTALAKAIAVDENANAVQKEVDDAAYELSEALRNLKAVVNKNALRAAIDRTKDLKETDYTATSWKAMQAALKAADEAMKSETVTQEEVNAATAALREALEALVRVDKTGLQAAIDLANGKNEADFPDKVDEWAALQAALAKAMEVAGNVDAVQKEVDDAARELNEALRALDTEGTINKDALEVAIGRTKDLKESDYTAASWKALQEALKTAVEATESETVTQEEVNAATAALRDAIAALVRVDKAGLRDAINRANERTEADYTKESWAAMQTALAKAVEVAENKDAVQKEVDDATFELSEALRNLKEVVNKNALKAAIDRTKELKESDHTAASWKAMQEALKTANQAMESETATQEEVNAATAALRDALAALVRVDKAGLRDAINRANERKEADYTKESWAAMQTALAKAKKVEGNADAVQKEVDDATFELSEALRNLVETDPGRTELNAALSAAKALRKDDYTPEAWAVFQKALADAEAVFNNPKATKEQTAAAAASLKKAIEEVKKNPAKKNPQPVVVKAKKISISGLSKKIAAGKKVKLTAKISPSNVSNKGVTWKSSNKKVATVNSKGVVTMKKKSGGKSVTITATAKDGSKVKATYKIKSMKGKVTKVTISGKKSVKAGKTLKLTGKVKATKSANKKLKWTSSNKKYATVTSSGKVKALKAGKGKRVKITAMAADGSGKKKTVVIKITK